MTLTIPIYLLATHFVADFIFQSDWMALNKSKDNKALGVHCLIYSLCFVYLGLLFSLLTLLTHFTTDFLTSRLTSKLWFVDLRIRSNNLEKILRWPFFAKIDLRKRHWFFVMIGFDQLIHYVTLALTYRFLFGV